MNIDQNIIYFVTGNIHKYNEISAFFKKENLNYILKQKIITTIEVQAESIKEIALYKLESIKGQVNGSYFIEDAGFEAVNEIGKINIITKEQKGG